MPIRINTNITALRTLRNLGLSTDRLSGSIEKLSSGLRINHASDDPAGLTISQKLRTQVDGVKRASLNAQDGSSMLQVAEAALGEIQGIVQRMRDLAVQAANGVYTRNDRIEIQREIDQLLEEIDRISETTEFNGRRLIDGTATGLASQDSSDVSVVFRDTPAEGNYRITKSNVPGLAQVLKSDIFGLAGGATRGRAVNIQQTILAPPDGLNNADFTGFTNLEFTQIPLGSQGNLTRDFQAEVYTPVADQVSVADHHFATTGGRSGFQVLSSAPLAAGTTGYYEIEITDVEGSSILAASSERITATVRRFAADGDLVDAQSLTVDKATLTAAPAPDSVGWFASLAGGPTAAELSVRVGQIGDRLDVGDRWLITANAAADFTGNILQFRQDQNELSGFTATMNPSGLGTFSGAGNVTVTVAALDALGRELGRTGQIDVAIAAGTDEVDLTWDTVAGATTYRVYSGDAGAGITGFVDVASPALNYTLNGPGVLGGVPPFATAWNADAGQGTTYDNQEDRFSLWTQVDAVLTGGASYDTSLVYYDRDGRVSFATGSVRLGLAGTTPVAGSAEFSLLESSLAERTTLLRNIDKFQSGEGQTYVDSGTTITIYGNGTHANVVLQGNDTLEGFAAKIRDAIVRSKAAGGLAMGVDGNLRRYSVGAYPAGVDGNTCVFVDNPATAGDEVIEGTLVVRSTIPDSDGRLEFAGDEGLLAALSFATIQEPTDSFMEVTAHNAHTGVLLGSQMVSDGIVRGLVTGIDLYIDQRADTSVTYDEAKRAFTIASAAGDSVDHIHIVDSALRLQTGANEGEVLRASLGEISVASLELSGLLVVSEDLATEAIGRLDRAGERVSSERAKLGAYLNRLDITTRVLDITADNLTASESRIRDLDIAEETVDFTRDQILQQTGTALLAQANAIPQSVLQLLR